MTAINVRVVGLRELDFAFREAARAVGTRGKKRAGVAAGEVILERAKENIRTKLYRNRTGALEESGHIDESGRWPEVVFDAVYAAVHEYGLENQPITAKQRAFFWAMWYETGEEMWKALALSTTYTIPARPYLRPAYDEARDEAIQEMGKAIRHECVQAARRRTGIKSVPSFTRLRVGG